jgi:site-specific recombinase XerD
MPAELVPADQLPSHGDGGEEDNVLRLVREWLFVGFKDNSRATYADSIGWPYTAAGEWRGFTSRRGISLLGWCYTRGVHPLSMDSLNMNAWVEDLNASDLSKRSKAGMVSTASSFYLWAFREGHVPVNPVSYVDRKKKGLNTSSDASPTRSLSQAEAHAMLRAADNDPVASVRLRTAALMALLLEVGPRVSEAVNATLADMSVQDGRRTLKATLKGDREHRYALPPSVCRRIDAYLEARTDMDRLPVKRGQVSASSAPLFATGTGKPMQRSEAYETVRRIAKVAGIDDPKSVHPHVARHSYVTEARRQGHATADIQAAMGHLFASTTDRYGTQILQLERSPAYGVADAFEGSED